MSNAQDPLYDGASVLDDLAWHYVVGAWAPGGNKTVYIDGQVVQLSASPNAAIAYQPDDLTFIGGGDGTSIGASLPFHGDLDEARSNRSRSTSCQFAGLQVVVAAALLPPDGYNRRP